MEKVYTYNKRVARKITEMVQNGVKIDSIIGYLNKHYQSAPPNKQRLYELYGDTIKAARAEATNEIGGEVREQAKQGHFKSQELYLTTQSDWTKKEEIDVGLAEGEDGEDAISTILGMLKKDK